MVETLRHRNAFEDYFLLGQKRTIDIIASKYKVNRITVGKWSINFHWQQRIVERDKKIADKLSKKTDKSIVDIKANYIKLLQMAIRKCLIRDSQGKVKDISLEPRNVSELIALIKGHLFLLGEVTEHITINELEKLTEDELLKKLEEQQKLIKKNDEGEDNGKE